MDDHPDYNLFEGDDAPHVITPGENSMEKYQYLDMDQDDFATLQGKDVTAEEYDKLIPPYLQAQSHVREALKILQDLPARRSLSIAITHLDTARLWIHEAKEEDVNDQTA